MMALKTQMVTEHLHLQIVKVHRVLKEIQEQLEILVLKDHRVILAQLEILDLKVHRVILDHKDHKETLVLKEILEQ